MSDHDWLAEVKARAEVATKGPWGVGEAENAEWSLGILSNSVLFAELSSDGNANFIAHAREDIPRLVTVVEAADRLAARMKWVMEYTRHSCVGFCPDCAALAAFQKARGTR
jgi:hypothetical protein